MNLNTTTSKVTVSDNLQPSTNPSEIVVDSGDVFMAAKSKNLYMITRDLGYPSLVLIASNNPKLQGEVGGNIGSPGKEGSMYTFRDIQDFFGKTEIKRVKGIEVVATLHPE